MDEDFERTLLVKPEVFIYKIPPRASARGYRAADWNLTNPEWTGRLRCVARGKRCELRLEDKNSGELFACCPIDQYPGPAIESVTDSSRYFVVCIQDSGRKAYLGMGFSDRSDSFDLNVTMQDHFKWLKKEIGFSKEASEPAKPNLDLAFKEGQTIRINIPKRDVSSQPLARPKPVGAVGLPPPPGGVKIGPPPPGAASLTPMQSPSEPFAKSVIGGGPGLSNVDLLGDLLGGSVGSAGNSKSDPADPWGDFASASSAAANNSSGNWVQF